MCCNNNNGKIIVLSAPSGTGKSTIIGELMKMPDLNLGFSVSATSRAPRGTEQDGVQYYFLSPDEFAARIERGEFVEWAEVYSGTRYGTLVSEVERVTGRGMNLIMDIDVEGALNVKKRYGDLALLIFIEPPTLQSLEERLRSRATDDGESIRRRLDKAEYEMSFADRYDKVVVNDDLDTAVSEVADNIRAFTE
jgi:guanylate kinase